MKWFSLCSINYKLKPNFIIMFMSWGSSPRSLHGVLGLNRFVRGDKHHFHHQHQHHHNESLCHKVSYAIGIATLASILWIWALLIHDVYKRTITPLSKALYIILVTVLSSIVFIFVLYVTLTLCRSRRTSSQDQQANDNQQQNVSAGSNAGSNNTSFDHEGSKQSKAHQHDSHHHDLVWLINLIVIYLLVDVMLSSTILVLMLSFSLQ